MWAPNVPDRDDRPAGLRRPAGPPRTDPGGDLADMAEVLFGWLRRRRA